MEQQQVKTYPFYIKATTILLGLILLVYTLRALQDILVPFAMSALIAILLNPLSSRLEKRLPKSAAIFVTVSIGIVTIGALFYFLSHEITNLGANLPILKEKFYYILDNLQHWLQTNFGISIERQIAIIAQAANNNMSIVGHTIGTIWGTISVLIFIPFYVSLLLVYKNLIIDFLFNVFSEKNSMHVAAVLGETKSTIQSYIVGLLIETVIVSAMNSVALLFLDVPYAILIGVIGGLLNILPYIGGIIAILLPVLVVTMNKDGYSTQVAVIAAYILIQLVDNNILVPRIVSSKVQMNSLFSIIAVLLGGALWGVSGMFLSIPFMAVLKIIFDRIDGMKPWGRLLGTEIPAEHIGVAWQKRWNRITRKRLAHKDIVNANNN